MKLVRINVDSYPPRKAAYKCTSYDLTNEIDLVLENGQTRTFLKADSKLNQINTDGSCTCLYPPE